MSTPAESGVCVYSHQLHDTRRVLIATGVSEPTRLSLTSLPTVYLRADLAATPSALPEALSTLRPHTLIVGANTVDAAAIAAWTAAVHAQEDPNGLLIVRRGTSLAAIDRDCAAAHGITVVNTPEVNARHIARFVVNALLIDEPDPHLDPGTVTVGLIGAGAINGRVAQAAAARGHRILVHTPSLTADPQARVNWLSAHAPADATVTFAPDVATVFAGSDLLSIAVPLTTSGLHPTDGLVGTDHVKAFAGTRIVAICEPEVLIEDAIMHAYSRRELTVVIDNAPGLVDPLRQRILERFPDGTALRPGFTVSSAAMRMPGCAEDLDQAVLTVVATSEVADLFAGLDAARTPGPAATAPAATAPAGCGAEPTADRHEHGRRHHRTDPGEIVIIGAGIVGLTIALSLHTAGWRKLRVLDAAPADRTDPNLQGTTYRGTDGRHLSLTETIPHADASRRTVLRRPPTDGGWQLRDPITLNDTERDWVAAFEGFADRAGLRALTVDLAIGLNRLGLRGWEALFAAYPHAFDRLRRDARLPRCYLSAPDLAAGIRLQGAINSTARVLGPDEIALRWPALITATADPVADLDHSTPVSVASVHGAVEVDGYAVNIHQLADTIGNLVVAAGVPVHSGSPVRSLRRIASGNPAGSSDDLPDDLPGDGSHDSPDDHPGTESDTESGTIELVLDDGTTMRAGTVIVTIGGRDLVALLGEDAPSAGAVQHVLGVSVTLPNPGLRHALKVHAPDPIGVVNITLSPDSALIHASGGFGYLGLARPAPDDPRVAELMAALEDIVGQLLAPPQGSDGPHRILDRRTCERPMTPDGLPVLEAVDAFGGQVIVAAGTNAGGAVQAPALAILLDGLLAGERGGIHLALRPDRASLRSTSVPVSV
ncbi:MULTISPECIES: FAD-binding oxidoreductase [unclassified Frankia]|uniref:FAD-binding oxidoreductase n=1 Tax=unclassified Frankia TaxID=2632575 RepID=UPI002AD5A11E|nr:MULTISPECIES: FAD-binding oxidoreductase [unclassified Frankia]